MAEVGETDRFEESTNLQYGVVEATIDEEDVHRPGECHIVLTKHDERYWLTFHAESDIETNILFDQFEWRPDEYTGTLYLKQSTGKHPVTVAMFDWHVAFPRDGFGLVGEWFVEQLDLDEYRAGVPCPKDDCDAEALHTGLASVCESPDCDFYAEGHIEAPHDDQQELATDGGQEVSRITGCPNCGGRIEEDPTMSFWSVFSCQDCNWSDHEPPSGRAITDGGQEVSRTPREAWEQHNESFQYEPPEEPLELWSNEEYYELYDRVISKERHGFTCDRCASSPFSTVERARDHVEAQHMERLLQWAKSRQEEVDDVV